jgi:hypothetical protein
MDQILTQIAVTFFHIYFDVLLAFRNYLVIKVEALDPWDAVSLYRNPDWNKIINQLDPEAPSSIRAKDIVTTFGAFRAGLLLLQMYKKPEHVDQSVWDAMHD